MYREGGSGGIRDLWRNIPIPETYLAAVIIGILIQIRAPKQLFDRVMPFRIAGCGLIVLGIVIVCWSLGSANDTDMNAPERLIDTGAYSLSRNPMYLAWLAIQIGLALVINSFWLLVFTPLSFISTHLLFVRKEEADLLLRFGDSYRLYCGKVRRYL